MTESHALAQLAELAADTLNRRNPMMASAGSCTGGLVSATITDVSGSSVWFERGFVAYSNKARSRMLGVPTMLIHEHGAMSEPAAHAMAKGAVFDSHAQMTVAITDVASPTNDMPSRPVGMMCFDWSSRLQTRMETRHFKDDCEQVRLQAAEHALRGLLDFLDSAGC